VTTPLSATPKSKLPVLFFIPGGGFQTGGITVPWQIPTPWVERSQAHIVVTINYRLGVFGFPNARGLDRQNLGIEDQRMALEWVRDNIEAFGGDPSRIMLWGQSAGSISTDIHSYAYIEDPIAASFFMQSASIQTPNALAGLFSQDAIQSNFTTVAKQLGCDFPSSADAELDCMRMLPSTVIMNLIGQYIGNSTAASPNFAPIVDDELVFSDYPARGASGAFARNPVVVGHTANEAASLVPYPASNLTDGPNADLLKATNLAAWICPAAEIADVRSKFDVLVYRYQYSGEFPNLNPLHWLGAYHSSDIPIMFGTHDILTKYGKSSDFEIAVSHAMQDNMVAFAADPWHGLEKLDWYNANTSGKVAEFGADRHVVRHVVHNTIDSACLPTIAE
jgi:carboxylesterase type B